MGIRTHSTIMSNNFRENAQRFYESRIALTVIMILLAFIEAIWLLFLGYLCLYIFKYYQMLCHLLSAALILLLLILMLSTN